MNLLLNLQEFTDEEEMDDTLLEPNEMETELLDLLEVEEIEEAEQSEEEDKDGEEQQ